MYDPQLSLVALHEERVVGFIGAWVNGDAYAWVDNLVVHPDYRKDRIGYYLAKGIAELLGKRGIRFIHVCMENPDLARALRQFGFKSKGMREMLVYDQEEGNGSRTK